MSVQVTIPTAQHFYFNEIRFNSYNVTQVTKLLRFSCTALDFGCNNYRMWDYAGKNMTHREKYLDWVKRWKDNYEELSKVIRFRKRMRQRDFFFTLEEYVRKANPKETADMSFDALYVWFSQNNVTDLAHLQKCAQHMLNGRFMAKLAGAEMRRREIEARQAKEWLNMVDDSKHVLPEQVAESSQKAQEADRCITVTGDLSIEAKSIELHPA